MAGSVNKVILIGNVGRDPESRAMQSGGKIVSFSVATSETWNDKASGERKEKTQWHRVAIFNERLGEVAERYVKKGTKVYIEGALESRKFTDQSGQEKEITEVVLARFRGELTLLDSRSGGGGGGGDTGDRDYGGGSGGTPTRAPARAPTGGALSWEPNRASDLDDDIPF